MIDYYSIENRVSNSFLSEFKKTLTGESSFKNPEALRFGSGLHCLLLEPHLFNAFDFTGKDRIKMIYMVASINQNADPKHLIGEKEKEFLYEYMDMPCKLKADIVGSDFVVDIKTTAANNLESFMEQALKFDYHRQAAWYLDCPLIQASKFVFIAVSKTAPYPVFTWELDKYDTIIETGREEYKLLIDYIKLDPALMERFQSQKVLTT
jgi:hypothetical protein